MKTRDQTPFSSTSSQRSAPGVEMGTTPHYAHSKPRLYCRMAFSFLPSPRGNSLKLDWVLVLLAIFLLGSPLHAQTTEETSSSPGQYAPQKLNREELGQLLAPIALYPDALIALILPASTVPSDIVLGARFLQTGGDPDQAGNKSWDDSVKSLARYPDVLTWMDQNLEWTASVGEAFVEQPADVMNAIQALREQALAAGNLQDTPEQRVVVEDRMIRIVPADPQVIYVPQYDPQIVYIQSYSPVPVLTFGIGFAVGAWLNYDFDWNRRCIYRGNWRGWNHDWNDNWRSNGNQNGGGRQGYVVNIDNNNLNQWQPGADSRRQTSQRQRNNNGNARYINNRTGPIGGEARVDPRNTASRTGSPAVFNPAIQSTLPQPSRWERAAGRENERVRGQAAPGSRNPAAANQSDNPAGLIVAPGTAEAGRNANREESHSTPPGSPRQNPDHSRPPVGSPGLPGGAVAEASPAGPKRTRPVSVPPVMIGGQMNEPGRPRIEKKDSVLPVVPSAVPVNTPKSEKHQRPANPPPRVPAPIDLSGQPRVPVGSPQNSRIVNPPVTQPASEPVRQAPAMKHEQPQPAQSQRQQIPQQQKVQQPQERPQVQQPRQQPQERPQVQQPRQQPQERPQVQQPRQQPQERPQVQQPPQQPQARPVPAAAPNPPAQVQAPSGGEARHKKDEKKAE
ncbi:MAG: DUF3300 domain-containing protein [Terrimicrobiaceae bacterium]